MEQFLNEFVEVITHPFVLMLMGLFSHFGKKTLAAMANEAEVRPCITDYWKKQPIQTSLAFIGALAGYAMFAHFPDFPDMSPDMQGVVRVTAFGVGYMADSVVDVVSDKVVTKIRGGAK